MNDILRSPSTSDIEAPAATTGAAMEQAVLNKGPQYAAMFGRPEPFADALASLQAAVPG